MGAGTSPPALEAAVNGSSIPLAAPLPVLAGDRIAVTIVDSGTGTSAWVYKETVIGASYDTFGPIADGTSESRTQVDGAEPLLNAEVLLDAPVVTGVSPSSGTAAGGQQVTISGDHLTGTTGVSFGGQPATAVNVLSDTVVTALTPASAPNSGPALIAAVVGTRLSYQLSEAATTTFRVERALPGFRSGGRCVKRRPPGRIRRCTRFVRLKGRLMHAGVQGANRLRFMGRLRNRQLRPGRYRLDAVSTDAAGNRSKAARRAFRIVRP